MQEKAHSLTLFEVVLSVGKVIDPTGHVKNIVIRRIAQQQKERMIVLQPAGWQVLRFLSARGDDHLA